MKNKRLEIDERLYACIAEKDRAGCRGWLQYRIQGKYGPEVFKELFEKIENQGGSFVWEEFEDGSLPPISKNESEWSEEYLQTVLTTLKFNFSKKRFTHAIEVASKLYTGQEEGHLNVQDSQSSVMRMLASLRDKGGEIGQKVLENSTVRECVEEHPRLKSWLGIK